MRAIDTKSNAPSSMAASAISGVMRPTAITGTPTAAFTARALSTSRPGTCGAYESVGPVAMPGSWYAETCTASAPAASAMRATAMQSSSVVPSGRFSVELSRHHTAKSSPTRARISRRISTRMRARFSIDPPYSSSRWFFAGDRKLSIR